MTDAHHPLADLAWLSGTWRAPGHAVFENPTHDFPTRLSYMRVGDRLTSRVEGPNGKGFTTELTRA